MYMLNSFWISLFDTLLTVSPCLHTRLSRLLERFFGSPSSSMSSCVDAQVTHLTALQRIRCHGTDFTADKTAKWHNFGFFFGFSWGWNCSRSRRWWRFLIGFLVKVDLWRAKDDDSGHNNLYLFFFMSCELSIIILISHRQVTDKSPWCAHVGA